mmetsp:Transcript_37038/g.105885  ORF Transcript_37038/g.105885 Transcript_37038/m.105885 type:complete len:296 (+) Transcript_37038:1108-1995(+)
MDLAAHPIPHEQENVCAVLHPLDVLRLELLLAPLRGRLERPQAPPHRGRVLGLEGVPAGLPGGLLLLAALLRGLRGPEPGLLRLPPAALLLQSARFCRLQPIQAVLLGFGCQCLCLPLSRFLGFEIRIIAFDLDHVSLAQVDLRRRVRWQELCAVAREDDLGQAEAKPLGNVGHHDLQLRRAVNTHRDPSTADLVLNSQDNRHPLRADHCRPSFDHWILKAAVAADLHVYHVVVHHAEHGGGCSWVHNRTVELECGLVVSYAELITDVMHQDPHSSFISELETHLATTSLLHYQS